MGTINDLNTTDTIADDDKLVIWKDQAGATRAITAEDAANYFSLSGGPYQPLDELLTSIAALGPSTTTDRMFYTTAQDTVALSVLTAYARSLLASSSAASWRDLLEIPNEGVVYLEEFGTSADWNAALTAALATATSAGLVIQLLPATTYSFANDIIIDRDGIELRGYGGALTGVQTGTVIALASGRKIQLGSASAYINNPVLRNFHLTQAGGTEPAIHQYAARNLITENISGAVQNGYRIGNAGVAVTGAADNGAGLIRITVGSAQDWQTGLRMQVNFVGGVAEAEGEWIVTRISSTTFDLQGSTFSTGPYTSGGLIAPTNKVLTISGSGNCEFSIAGANNRAIDVRNISGTIFIDGVLFVNTDLTAGVPNAGSIGVNFPKGASAYDRIDWARFNRSAFRLFEVGFNIDNTRVVSIDDEGTLYDGCTTGIKYRADSVDSTGGGFENWKIIRPRFQLDSDLTSTWVDIDLAAVAGGKLFITDGEGVCDGTAIKIDGGSVGLVECQIKGALIDARPASSTHYGVQLEGALTQVQVQNITARKSSGAGTLANAVRLVTGYTGNPIIRDVQASGHTGLAIEDPDGNAYQEEAPGVFRGAQKQRFQFQIRNNAGTLQHAIAASGLSDTAAYAGLVRKINAASGTWGNTPTGADASTAFATGGKISSATAFRFIFDTAAQTNNRMLAMPVVALETVGDAVKVFARTASIDVDGVTRNRLVFDFYNAGASWSLNTTNIAAGEAVYVQCEVWLE